MDNNTVLLVSKGFNNNDGIGRISRELYSNLKPIRENIVRLDLESYSKNNKNPLMQFIGKQREFNAFKFVKNLHPRIIHAQAPDHASLLAYNRARRILTWEDTVVYDRIKESTGLLYFKYLYKALLWNEAFFNADVIIDISSLSKKNREQILGKKRKSYVVPLGIDNVFIENKASKKRDGFAYVGSVQYANKNIPLLFKFISLLNAVVKEEVKLYIYTSTPNAESYLSDLLQTYKIKVILFKNKSDKEISDSLSNRTALLHLAKSEGFGLPILEATAIGLPVLTLKDADIPEEVRKYAYIESIDNLLVIAKDLIKSNEILSDKAIAYARSFTWEKYAENINQIYDIEG
jgi:glycosyltransferase involved in cell wall biosynthesis